MIHYGRVNFFRRRQIYLCITSLNSLHAFQHEMRTRKNFKNSNHLWSRDMNKKKVVEFLARVVFRFLLRLVVLLIKNNILWQKRWLERREHEKFESKCLEGLGLKINNFLLSSWKWNIFNAQGFHERSQFVTMKIFEIAKHLRTGLYAWQPFRKHPHSVGRL